jgi:carbonyl reductase 1
VRRVAAVTGANRGIGLEIARGLARAGLRVLGTSRHADGASLAAIEGAGAELELLDVADAKSRTLFAERVGPVDVLVNNAAVSLDGFDARVARATLDTNFFGAMHLTDALLPRMRFGGRVVMVSSGMGELSCLEPALAARFASASLDRAELVRLAESFVEDVAAGRWKVRGWPTSAYAVSKVCMNALVRVLARELAGDPRRILVNAACPGWVRTRMGGRHAPRSPEEGADTPVWLALLPEGGPTGQFFRDRRAVPF